MEFCPTCGMLLQLEGARSGRRARLFCPTCPYFYSIERKIVKKQILPRKQVDAIFNEEDSMKTAQKSDSVTCGRCGGTGAYFYELQTRSADEPMTIFYMCCNLSCKAQWRHD